MVNMLGPSRFQKCCWAYYAHDGTSVSSLVLPFQWRTGIQLKPTSSLAKNGHYNQTIHCKYKALFSKCV